MTPSDIVNVIKAVGLPLALLILVLWTGSRGVWTWGRETKRERERADRFEQLAWRSVTAAEGGTEVAKRLAEEQQERQAALVEQVVQALQARDP